MARPDPAAAVAALAQAIALREGDPPDAAGHAAAFVRAACARAPGYLRPPLALATWLFDAWPCLRLRGPFHGLPPDLRLAQVRRWEASRLAPARMFMTFYASLIVFALREAEREGER